MVPLVVLTTSIPMAFNSICPLICYSTFGLQQSIGLGHSPGHLSLSADLAGSYSHIRVDVATLFIEYMFYYRKSRPITYCSLTLVDEGTQK